MEHLPPDWKQRLLRAIRSANTDPRTRQQLISMVSREERRVEKARAYQRRLNARRKAARS